MRERVLRLVESPRFQWFIIGVILLNAAILGLEVSPNWMADHGDATLAVGRITVAIFVVEIALRIYAHGTSFFRGPWNLFDLFVVGISLIPGAGSYAVLRVLRSLRVLRLLSTIRSMRIVVAALVTTVPGMISIGALLGMLLYICAVVATQLFGDVDPENFGSLATSLLSMFQITTGDDWANVIGPATDAYPAAWIFFILFIVLSTYIVLNLFIAVAVEALDRETEEAADVVEDAVDESTATILAALADLKAQVSALESRLDRTPE